MRATILTSACNLLNSVVLFVFAIRFLISSLPFRHYFKTETTTRHVKRTPEKSKSTKESLACENVAARPIIFLAKLARKLRGARVQEVVPRKR